MKINKQITLDSEIMEKLRQEGNASALIEGLLKEHYEFNGEKKNNHLQNRMILLKNYSKKAKDLKNEVKIFNKIEQLGCDYKTIRWLLGHDSCPDILECHRYKEGRGIKIRTADLQSVWDIINKKKEVFEKI